MGVDGVTGVVIEEEFAYACTGIGVALEGNGLAVRLLKKIKIKIYYS